MRRNFAAIVLGLAALASVPFWSLHAQQSGCRTSPLDQQAITNYCASEAFVSRHFPSGAVTAGHVATFADTSGQILQDGGTGGTVSSVSAGQGITATPNPIVGTGTIATSPGVDANVLISQTSDRTVQTTDCGGTIRVSGGSWTVTLPAVTGFDGKCVVTITDASTTRGQKLSGFPSDLYPILYPGKTLQVKIVNGAWVTSINPGRWAKQNLDFFVDFSGAGNNGNDGLAAGSGGAFASLNQCRAAAQISIDTISGGNGGVTCHVPSGQTVQEFVQVFFSLTGGGSLIFQGDGGQFNWKPANSGYALQFGDEGVVGLTNINFTTAGTTSPQAFVLGHNLGVADFNANISFDASSVAILNGITCDFDSHININNGLNYVGTYASFLFLMCQNSTWDISNAINSTGTTSTNRWFWARSGATVIFEGNATFGTTGLTASAAFISGNAVVNNLSASGAPPGGAPTTFAGGQYCVPGSPATGSPC